MSFLLKFFLLGFLSLFPRYWPSQHGDSVCGGRRCYKALSKADKDSAEVDKKEHIGKQKKGPNGNKEQASNAKKETVAYKRCQAAAAAGESRSRQQEDANVGNPIVAEHKESAHEGCKPEKNKVEDEKWEFIQWSAAAAASGEKSDLLSKFLQRESTCLSTELGATTSRDSRAAGWEKQPKKGVCHR